MKDTKSIFKRKESKLTQIQKKTEKSINSTNEKIDELGTYIAQLYNELNTIQQQFNIIRNIPEKDYIEFKKLEKIRLDWKQQTDKIEADYNKAEQKIRTGGGTAAAAGTAVAAFGPTAAMGIATTFGVASTGTAISTLSGAAATNAALAWLGGGALAAGGGGMAAGQALLALAGPVGWIIGGAAVATTIILSIKNKNDMTRLEDIFTGIGERDIKSHELAVVEIKERIRSIKNETQLLSEAIKQIKIFGYDYDVMTEKQQYELGSYVNLMRASTQLLVNPILALQPKYTEQDLNKYLISANKKLDKNAKNVVVYLANLLYKLPLSEQDLSLLWKSFKNNKEFLKSFDIKKNDFDLSLVETAYAAIIKS